MRLSGRQERRFLRAPSNGSQRNDWFAPVAASSPDVRLRLRPYGPRLAARRHRPRHCRADPPPPAPHRYRARVPPLARRRLRLGRLSWSPSPTMAPTNYTPISLPVPSMERGAYPTPGRRSSARIVSAGFRLSTGGDVAATAVLPSLTSLRVHTTMSASLAGAMHLAQRLVARSSDPRPSSYKLPEWQGSVNAPACAVLP